MDWSRIVERRIWQTRYTVAAIALACGCQGRPQPFRPAAHAALPLVQKGPGPVLASPKIAAITFAGDPLAGDIENFVTRIGSSRYWAETTSEYGVGPAKAVPAVRVADMPALTMMTDDEIRSWLGAQLTAKKPGWATPDGSTVYVVYYPAETSITIEGEARSCTSFLGYHSSFTLADGTAVPYAVVARCPSRTISSIDSVTEVTSHELIEAATDPFPLDAPAFQRLPDTSFAWTEIYRDETEVADMCALERSSIDYEADLRALVQRSWSNAAAEAGHDPCVPAASGDVYFGAAPDADEAITLSFKPSGQLNTRGLHIPIGSSRTIPLRLFSDAPTGAFDVWAAEYPVDSATPTTGNLRFMLDKPSGANGDIVYLTISVVADQYGEGHEYAVIYAQLGDVQHRWPIVIGN